MRRVVTIALLVSAFGAVFAPASLARSRPCPYHRSRLLKADRLGQVYVGEILHGEGAGETAVFWCTYSHRRSYELGQLPSGSSSGANGIALLKLSGPMVAFDEFSSVNALPPAERGFRRDLVVVRDLRTGRTLHRIPSGVPESGEVGVGVGYVARLVLKDDGAAAWTAYDEERSTVGHDFIDVEVVDASGTRLVESGFTIDPRSLRLTGSKLTWLEGSESRSTTLR